MGPWPDPRATFDVTVRTVEPVSPVDAETLLTMSVEEIAELCRSFKRTDDAWLDDPSARGLEGALRTAVSAKPARFAAKAGLFRPLGPGYVLALLSGLRGVSIRHPLTSLDWKPVFDLVLNVVEEHGPDLESGAGSEAHYGRDWTGVRREAANLLAAAFGLPYGATSEGSGESIRELSSFARAKVVRILRALTSDPDPGPELLSRFRAHAKRWDALRDNPGLMTTRARALDAVVSLAWWLRRQGVTEPHAGLTSAPDIQDLLDARLRRGVEATFFVHAIFGFRFRRLAELDPTWAASRAGAIFGDVKGVDDRQAAAWRAYLHDSSDPIHAPLWEALHDRYVLSLEASGAAEEGEAFTVEEHGATDAEIVGCHLIDVYGTGILSLGDPELGRFFERASPVVRATALRVAAPPPTGEGQDAPAEVLDRLRELWEWRLETLTSDSRYEPQEAAVELRAFSAWFASGAFGDDWALDQFLVALERSGAWADISARDFRALPRLAELAADPALTGKVIACVRALLAGTFDVRSEERALAEIVRRGVEHAPAETDDVANILGNRLGPAFLDAVKENAKPPALRDDVGPKLEGLGTAPEDATDVTL
jgi:hypothetical protein